MPVSTYQRRHLLVIVYTIWDTIGALAPVQEEALSNTQYAIRNILL
ncbi:hypothetical protein ACG2F4_02170 [Halalkalibaculum sp. DA3122]